MIKRGCTLRLESVSGDFNSIRTGSRMSLALEGSRVLTVLKRGKDKGAALVGVVCKVCCPSRKRVFMGKGRMAVHSPGSSCRLKVNVMRRRFGLMSMLAMTRGVILKLPKGKGLSVGEVARSVRGLTSGCNFRLSLSRGVCRVSISRGRAIRVVGVLCHNTEVLVLSRPATILAPRRSSQLFSVLEGVEGSKYSVVVVARGLRRILTLSSHITVLEGKGCVSAMRATRTGTRDLSRVVMNNEMSLGVSHPRPRGMGGQLIIGNLGYGGGRRMGALSSISLAMGTKRVLNVTNVSKDNRGRFLRTVTKLRTVRDNSVALLSSGKGKARLTKVSSVSVGGTKVDLTFIPRSHVNVKLINSVSVASGVVLEDCHGNGDPFLSQGNPGTLTLGVGRRLRIVAPDVSTPIHRVSKKGMRGILMKERVTRGPGILLMTFPAQKISIGASRIVCHLLGRRGGGKITMIYIVRSLSMILRLYSEVTIFYKNGVDKVRSKEATAGRRVKLLVAGRRGKKART